MTLSAVTSPALHCHPETLGSPPALLLHGASLLQQHLQLFKIIQLLSQLLTGPAQAWFSLHALSQLTACGCQVSTCLACPLS